MTTENQSEFPWAVENRVVKGPILALFRDREDADDYVKEFLDLRVRPASELIGLEPDTTYRARINGGDPVELKTVPAPTDDEREALLAEADALVESWDHRGSWSADSPVGMVMRLARALRRSEVPEPQGEPSDARVLAALNAYDPAGATEDLSDYSPEHVQDMRAALRAAGRVR